ncbi:MAG TPA: NAD(P)/FAD-dependent oxidoreductase [Blastocatellia bacterium]|nr:NAD(P)/FAD-dependent oxidoreductase [Blastocatellia bacterium]
MKIIIIGASTTGLFAAALLSRAGANVEVYERSGALDFAPRTYIVTDKISEVLGFVPKEAILNEVKYVELFSRSRSTTVKLARPDLIIERQKLLLLLARMAEEAGAKIFLGRRFLSFTSSGEGVNVVYRDSSACANRETKADILIGADGVFSGVARSISHNGHFQTALLQARVRINNEVNRDTYRVWFDPARTKYFYWLIPESDEIAAVGLIADDARQAGGALKSFLMEQGMEPIDYQASMVPMHKFQYFARVDEISRNVFLIGDAAAQVKVTTVGGVVTGLRGARAVVEAVLNGKKTGKETSKLKRELDLHLLVRRLLDGFNDLDYDTLIDSLNGELNDIVSNQTRDDLSRMYLDLISSQPKLLFLGARAFLRGIAFKRRHNGAAPEQPIIAVSQRD